MPVSRRIFLLSITVSAVTLSRQDATAACALIQSQIDAANAQIQTVDAWVSSEGPGYVSQLEQNFIELEKRLASATAASDKAEYDATISLISVSTCLIMTVLGLTGVVAAAPLFVTGLAISATLMVAKARYSVAEKDAVQYAAMKGAEDLNLVLSAAQDDVTFIMYKGKIAGVEKIIGSLVLFYELFSFLQDASDANDKKMKLNTIKNSVSDARQEVQSLKEPGNLRAARLDSLKKIKERLEANDSLCTGQSPSLTAP